MSAKQVLYLVLSGEPFGKGIIGAFSTVEQAVKFAESESEAKNIPAYIIYKTVLDNPDPVTKIVKC